RAVAPIRPTPRYTSPTRTRPEAEVADDRARRRRVAWPFPWTRDTHKRVIVGAARRLDVELSPFSVVSEGAGRHDGRESLDFLGSFHSLRAWSSDPRTHWIPLRSTIHFAALRESALRSTIRMRGNLDLLHRVAHVRGSPPARDHATSLSAIS